MAQWTAVTGAIYRATDTMIDRQKASNAAGELVGRMR
jgi:hypothetical protein